MRKLLGVRVKARSAVMAVEESKSEKETEENLDSRWGDLPFELLREIFVRVEESGSNWPARRHVVACAGVCKSWRQVMKGLVQNPEVSGKITFPVSVKQPGPRDSVLHCFVKRDRDTQTYRLFVSLSQALTDEGKFILAARKCRHATCTDYMITLNADGTSKGGETYIGKLRSNFMGTKFVVYDALPPHSGAKMEKSVSTRIFSSKQVPPRVPVGNYPVAHVSFELNVLGTRGPRRMHCAVDAIPASAIKPGGVAPTQTYLPIMTVDSSPIIPFFRSKSSNLDKVVPVSISGQEGGSLVLGNKAPRWHEQLQCWCLNFHGRVTVASIKNFQLAASPVNGVIGPEHNEVILQFGKVGKDVFTLDYRYPISAFQAFAICLSTFDTKLACE